MSDIKIVITGDESGLNKATNQATADLGRVAIAAQKTDSSLAKMSIGLNATGNIAQKATSQVAGLASGLLSGGLITAVTLAGVALFELGKKLFDVTEEQKRLGEALEGGKAAYVKATIEVYNLRTAFNQAENGIIRKEVALKMYNDTLGKTLGKTKDFEEAEKSFIANASNYIKFTLLKAAANTALAKAAEAAFEIERNKQLGATKEGFFSAQNLVNILSGTRIMSDAERAILRIAEAQKSQNDYTKVYNSLMAQANALGFNQVAVDEAQVKTIKKKTAATEEYIKVINRAATAQGLESGFDKTGLSRGTGSTIEPNIIVKPKIEFIIDPEQEKKVFDGLNKLFAAERLAAFQKTATDAISATISNIMNDSVSTIADSVADALSGGQDVVPRLFDNIIKGIGGQVKELGKFLVKTGIEMLAAQKAVKALGLSPQGAIIAGFALQVLGGLLTAAAQKKSNSIGFATGVRDFQGGGIVTVGERGPERIFLPAHSTVQPNNEMQAFGGGSQVFIPAVTLSGSDLVIAFNRASNQMGRNN